MMEKNKLLVRYSSQILLIFVLELIILLFRIAVPVASNIYGVSDTYTNVVGEAMYFIIQLSLIIVVLNHCIFKKTYNSMGLVKENQNQNLFSLGGNLCYLAIVGVSTILLTKISGEIYGYTITQTIIRIILLFVSRAFVQEVIYRGCIMRNINKVFKNGVVAVVCSSLLFSIVHLSLGVIDSGFATSYISGLSMKFILTFFMGAYLGTLYYVTNNIWICIIIHGTYEAIPVVGYEILIPVFETIYVIVAVIYLAYEVVSSRKSHYSKEYDGNNYEDLECDIKERTDESKVEEYIDNNSVDKGSNLGVLKDIPNISINSSNEVTGSNVIDGESEGYINHLRLSLGELIGNYKNIIYNDLSINVLAFQGDKFNAIVTDGIRLKPMNVPEYLEGNAYAEMVVFVSKEFDISEQGIQKEENRWIINLLNDTIGQLKTRVNYLGWGQVFENNSMKSYKDEKETYGVFIYPPVVQENMTFYTFKEEDKITYIYSAMPVYKEEMQFIIQKSGDIYFSKLKEVNISQIVCKNRINICKDT